MQFLPNQSLKVSLTNHEGIIVSHNAEASLLLAGSGRGLGTRLFVYQGHTFLKTVMCLSNPSEPNENEMSPAASAISCLGRRAKGYPRSQATWK